MAVKIRLMRIGAKARPFYRIVAVDERAKRTGGYLELLGTYNPLTNPKEINIDQAKVEAWVKKGAQKSVGFLRITGNAPQRQPRPAKKVRDEKPAAAPAPATPAADATEEVAAETVEETPNTEVVETPVVETTEAEAPAAEETADDAPVEEASVPEAPAEEAPATEEAATEEETK